MVRSGMIKMVKTIRNISSWIAMIALPMIFATWQMAHLTGYVRDWDEGAYLMVARMVEKGYHLYSEVFSAQPPLFILSLIGGFKLFGPSVPAGRAVIVAYATLGLFAVALAAQQLKGKTAGLVAVFLLAFTPDFFYWCRGVLADLPSACLATLSIALALHYWKCGDRYWLASIGLVAAAGFLTKISMVTVLLPVTLLVLFGQDVAARPWRNRIIDVAFMLFFVSLPVLLSFLTFESCAMIDQMVIFHLQGREVYSLNLAQNTASAVSYLGKNAGLVALAVGGSAVLLTQVEFRKRVIILVLWFLVMGLSLLTHSPLFPRHQFVILLPPLAILGGALVSDMAERCHRLKEQTGWSKVMLAIGLCSLVTYGLHLPYIIEIDRQLIHGPKLRESEQRAIHFLETSVAEQDFIITDDQYLAFAADRMVPPSLVDTSKKRLDTNYLTGAELVKATIEYKVQAALVQTDGRFVLAAPEYVNWLRNNYRLAARYGEQLEVYIPVDFIRSNVFVQEPHLRHSTSVSFGNKLMFLGYDADEVVQKKRAPSWLGKYLNTHAELMPEHRTTFRITYFWRCLEEMEEDYTLVTQFDGRHGKTYRIDQSHQGVNGVYPTSMWREGEVIREEYQVEVPADYPPIRYALWVGVQYGEEALEVVSDVEADDQNRVRLGEIEVLPAEKPTPLAGVPQPQNSVETNINDEIVFLGYDLNERKPQPGEQLKVTTYWQSLRKTEEDYAIQVELRNGGYKVREGLDITPTRLWEEGGYYQGSAVISVNPRLLGGTYSLSLGLERGDETETQISLASLDIPWQRRHIIRRWGKANYGGSEILSPGEPLSLRFDLKERESLEVVAGWTGKAESEETRVEVYLWQPYSSERYLGTWVIRSGRYTTTKRRIPSVLTAPGENVIELRVPEVRERVHNIGWRGVMDRVFPDLLQDPRTDYDGPIQMDFLQVSSRWGGDWEDYYDLAEVYAERGMEGEVVRLYEEAVEEGVEPERADEFALFKRAYQALGEDGKVGEIEERIAGRIGHQVRVNLGGKVEFLGYSLRGEKDDRGLSLFFRCLEEMGEDYTLWVHGEVEDASLLEGQRREAGYAVFDHLLSTSRWQVGEVYQDDGVRGLRPGRYHFTLGLWRPEDGSRLWKADNPEAHVIDLGWVEFR
jgi:hypothetical protein